MGLSLSSTNDDTVLLFEIKVLLIERKSRFNSTILIDASDISFTRVYFLFTLGIFN